MTQGIKKASNRAYKPRSGAGIGKGGLSPIQRVVGPAIHPVPIPDERMGFVRQGVGGVCRVHKAGGVARVSAFGRGWQAPRRAQAGGLHAARLATKRHPFPPAPTVALWGTSLNFSPAFC
jgi:hypothetical protein